MRLEGVRTNGRNSGVSVRLQSLESDKKCSVEALDKEKK